MIVYLLTNTVNGKRYVGQTKLTLAKRWSLHCAYARRGSKAPVHVDIMLYGPDVFTQRVLSVASSRAVLHQLETFWIKDLSTRFPKEYNVTAGGYSGHPTLPETIEKLRITSTGRKASAEARLKMRRPRTAETCAAISAAALARGPMTSVRMQGNKHALGHKQSPEHVAKRVAKGLRTREERQRNAA